MRELSLHVGSWSFGLIGASKFALVDVAQHPPDMAMFLFAVVFMDTAATIPTGTLAERWKFSAFIVYGFFMSMVIYPVFANWVWGGGWLSSLGSTFGLGHGFVDFAGSSVVHMTGGVTALAGARVLGPRLGKFRKDGTVGLMAGHNLPLAVMGTFVLAFGWFGFNAGSTLAASDSRVAAVAVNTMIASATGALASLFFEWQRHRRPDIAMASNGLLGGLVAITAPCAFVGPPSAALIGLVAGLLVPLSVEVIERKWRIDDPVGAISVHGSCGVWGAISVGLLADGSYGEGWNGVSGRVTGILFGDPKQLLVQVIGVVSNFVFVFALAHGFFRVCDRLIGIRVAAEVEWTGLDGMEMGSDAYSHD
jgi:Amt family ammonium transporter